MRVVVADDSVLIREALVRVLSDAGFEVIAQVGDAEALLSHARRQRPDVVIVDIRMPPTHTTEGLVAARTIRAELPDTAVLVLSHHIETHHAMDLIASGGGVGYLLKDRLSDVAEVVDAIRRVAAGQSVMDPLVVQRLVARPRTANPVDTLSDRERDVLALMAEGRSNAAIGARLFLSPKTVETHIRSIFGKLDIPDLPDDNRRVLTVLTYLRSRS
jgi:serine/threonine-protein kinase